MSLYSIFVKNISFPIIAKRDGLIKLMEYLKKLEESQYWSRERILEHQFERIKALIIHAYNNTEYYKKKFNDVGFKPEISAKLRRYQLFQKKKSGETSDR